MLPAATASSPISLFDAPRAIASCNRCCACDLAKADRIVVAAAISDRSIRGALTGFPTTVERIDPTSPTPPSTFPVKPPCFGDSQRIAGSGVAALICSCGTPVPVSSARSCSFSVCCDSTWRGIDKRFPSKPSPVTTSSSRTVISSLRRMHRAAREVLLLRHVRQQRDRIREVRNLLLLRPNRRDPGAEIGERLIGLEPQRAALNVLRARRREHLRQTVESGLPLLQATRGRDVAELRREVADGLPFRKRFTRRVPKAAAGVACPHVRQVLVESTLRRRPRRLDRIRSRPLHRPQQLARAAPERRVESLEEGRRRTLLRRRHGRRSRSRRRGPLVPAGSRSGRSRRRLPCRLRSRVRLLPRVDLRALPLVAGTRRELIEPGLHPGMLRQEEIEIPPLGRFRQRLLLLRRHGLESLPTRRDRRGACSLAATRSCRRSSRRWCWHTRSLPRLLARLLLAVLRLQSRLLQWHGDLPCQVRRPERQARTLHRADARSAGQHARSHTTGRDARSRSAGQRADCLSLPGTTRRRRPERRQPARLLRHRLPAARRLERRVPRRSALPLLRQLSRHGLHRLRTHLRIALSTRRDRLPGRRRRARSLHARLQSAPEVPSRRVPLRRVLHVAEQRRHAIAAESLLVRHQFTPARQRL